MQEELFDKRVVERNIKKGIISRKDYQEYLKKLPDMSYNVLVEEEPHEEQKDREKEKKR